MYPAASKVDGVSTEPAAEYNSFYADLISILSSFGITPDGAQTDQLAKSIASFGLTGRYFSESGAADAYVLTAAPNTRKMPGAYLTGMIVEFVPGNVNTGASTINVSSLGVKAIKKADGTTALSAGDIVASGLTKLWYDGTNFRMHSSGVPYTPTAANALVGSRIQHRRYEIGSMIDCANASPYPGDNTDASNTQGDQIMTDTFTPLLSTSKIKITIEVNGCFEATNQGFIWLLLGADTAARKLGSMTGIPNVLFNSGTITFEYLPASVSTITAKVRASQPSTGYHFTFNGIAAAAKGNGKLLSSITWEEIKQ